MNFGKPVNIKPFEDLEILSKKSRDNFNIIWSIAKTMYEDLKYGDLGIDQNRLDIDKLKTDVSNNEELSFLLGEI